jgi:hypothetical protein
MADKIFYLVVKSDGLSQLDLAQYLLVSLLSQLIKQDVALSVDELSEDSVISLVYRSLPAALWSTIISHSDYELIRCKRCHDVVFTSKRGRTREFCSNACRIAYEKIEH